MFQCLPKVRPAGSSWPWGLDLSLHSVVYLHYSFKNCICRFQLIFKNTLISHIVLKIIFSYSISRATATHRGQVIFKDALAQQLCEQGGKSMSALFMLVVSKLFMADPMSCTLSWHFINVALS